MSRAKTTPDSPTGDEPKHKWRCPGGHVSWERINSHVWCHGCASELQGADAEDVDPEWWELENTSTGERESVQYLVNEVWPNFDEVSAY